MNEQIKPIDVTAINVSSKLFFGTGFRRWLTQATKRAFEAPAMILQFNLNNRFDLEGSPVLSPGGNVTWEAPEWNKRMQALGAKTLIVDAAKDTRTELLYDFMKRLQDGSWPFPLPDYIVVLHSGNFHLDTNNSNK